MGRLAQTEPGVIPDRHLLRPSATGARCLWIAHRLTSPEPTHAFDLVAVNAVQRYARSPYSFTIAVLMMNDLLSGSLGMWRDRTWQGSPTSRQNTFADPGCTNITLLCIY